MTLFGEKCRMSLQSDITIWYYSDINLSDTYHLHLWHDVIHWGALPDQLGQDPNLWKKPDGGRGTCELLDSNRRISVGDRIEPNKTLRLNHYSSSYQPIAFVVSWPVPFKWALGKLGDVFHPTPGFDFQPGFLCVTLPRFWVYITNQRLK